MTGDLVTFLRARLDEDERLARDAAKHCAALIAAEASKEGVWRPPYDGSSWGSNADHVYAADPRPGQPRADIADFGYSAFMLTPHIQNNSPARVLAEVDAKRRIMAIHAIPLEAFAGSVIPGAPDDRRCVGCGFGSDEEPMVEEIDNCPILQDLALPYRDHPDFQPEWAPE